MSDDWSKPVSADRLAELFDCSERHVYTLARRGLVVRHSAGGGFDMAKSVHGYTAHLKEKIIMRRLCPNARSLSNDDD